MCMNHESLNPGECIQGAQTLTESTLRHTVRVYGIVRYDCMYSWERIPPRLTSTQV
jgi:hypothetical protein